MIIPRHHYYNLIHRAFKSLPIVALLGARQVGKTTIMKNIPLEGKTVFLNGQDPDVQVLFTHLHIIVDYLKIHLNRELSGYVLIDEFQFIPQISTMLKLLTDQHESLKIFCSGSSSLNIFSTLEESLAGRIRIIDVFPLNFAEFIQFYDDQLFQIYQEYPVDTQDEIISPEIKLKFKEYLIYGGFPRVALTNSTGEKIDLLNDIYQTYLLRDVRHYIRNVDVIGFNKLLKLLAAQISNLVNINELSRLSGLSYKRCEEYLFLLEQMYIIKLLPPFYTNVRKTITKMKKVYFIDTGLRNLIYNNFNAMDFRVDNGMIFENYVFLELKKKLPGYGSISFFRTPEGTEVDFIMDILSNRLAFEVKWKQFDKPVPMRRLQKLAQSIQCQQVYLVNINLNETIEKLRYLPGYFSGKLTFDSET